MSLIDRLLQAAAAAFHPSRPVEEPDPGARERLAVAALLVHVARADGRLDPRERTRLEAGLAERFGLDPAATRRLLDDAVTQDRETGDLGLLIERAREETGPGERVRLVALAYAVAAADGTVQEMEDDLAWRLGRRLGLSDAEIAAARADGAP